MRLSWNRPSENGGSAIIRYEYRYAATGEAWTEREKVGAGTHGVALGGLINGREYEFEVRPVNALGKGATETVMLVKTVATKPVRARRWHRINGILGNYAPGTQGYIRILKARPAPRGIPVDVCCISLRASRVAASFLFHACKRQYPGGNGSVPPSLSSPSANGLPLMTGGSASALQVSRPARRSLAFRPG